LALAGVALFVLFAALGWWQAERRVWKLQLIERVSQRLQEPPAPLPPPGAWAGVDAAGHEYQPVQATGRWLPDKTVLTQATTEVGEGCCGLTSLQLLGGEHVLVNRGFSPQALRAEWPGLDPVARAGDTSAQVTGRLRMGGPGGGFLR